MEFLTPAWSDTIASSWLVVSNVLFLKTMGNFHWVKASLLFPMQKDDCTSLADTQFKYSQNRPVQPGIVVYAFNPNSQEAKASRSL